MAEKGVRFGSITLNGKTIDIDKCSIDTLEQMKKELAKQAAEAKKETSSFLSSVDENTTKKEGKEGLLEAQVNYRELFINQSLIEAAIFSKSGYELKKDNLDKIAHDVLEAARPHGIAAEKVAKQETASVDEKKTEEQERVD